MGGFTDALASVANESVQALTEKPSFALSRAKSKSVPSAETEGRKAVASRAILRNGGGAEPATEVALLLVRVPPPMAPGVDPFCDAVWPCITNGVILKESLSLRCSDAEEQLG